VFLAQTTVAFDVVFGIFLVAIVVLTVLTVRFIRRQDRARRR
jgi:membrane protein implicated in regulation of membrane protease activity